MSHDEGGITTGGTLPPVGFDAEEAARVLQGSANGTRLRILDLLANGPCSVGDVCVRLGIVQPNVSHHLSRLADRRAIRRHQKGRFAFYELTDDGRAVLMAAWMVGRTDGGDGG